MIDLATAQHVVLAEQGHHDSHVLARRAVGWGYGERTCHSDTCLCVTHHRWHWQDCSETEAAEIVALFAAKGFTPKVSEF